MTTAARTRLNDTSRPEGRPAGGLRVFPQLRAAHIEEIDATKPRTTLYFTRNYDLDEEEVPDHVQQASLLQVMRAALAASATVELFEPLWVRYFPHWVLIGLSARLGALRRGSRRARIAFYAIENNRVETVIAGARTPSRPLVRVVAYAMGRAVALLADRCAFGTPGAQTTYDALLPQPSGVETRLVTDLLPPAINARVAKDRESVVFIGALERRKGVTELMPAWELLEGLRPDGHLTIIGDGVLRQEIHAWTAGNPRRRTYLGAIPRREVLSVLERASVLVAPSVPEGRWREQVGRPIQEALSRGMTVVTSDQTGLADVLERWGHHVIRVDELQARLPRALSQAIGEPLEPADVVKELPSIAGRMQADNWLHGDVEPNQDT